MDGLRGWGGEWWPEFSRRGGGRSGDHRLWTLEACAEQVEALVEQAFTVRRSRAAGPGELEAGDDRRDRRCSQQVWIDVDRGIGARSACDDVGDHADPLVEEGRAIARHREARPEQV